MNCKHFFFLVALALPWSLGAQEYRLVWSDEFDYEGRPDETKWVYEEGFVRNQELQWYQLDNAWCHGGLLAIEGRKEMKANPMYRDGSRDWRESRPNIECTSSCIKTKEKFSMLYGRVEVRARIPIGKGAWPAIWMLGDHMPWPACGEIDIMEYYRSDGIPSILANTCWQGKKGFEQNWITRVYPIEKWMSSYPEWPTEFHVWRMDWDENWIRIYLDDELLNETPLNTTFNESKEYAGVNPFQMPQYILLNLAIGGTGGLETKDDAFPLRYEVDYVRVYQKDR